MGRMGGAKAAAAAAGNPIVELVTLYNQNTIPLASFAYHLHIICMSFACHLHVICIRFASEILQLLFSFVIGLVT